MADTDETKTNTDGIESGTPETTPSEGTGTGSEGGTTPTEETPKGSSDTGTETHDGGSTEVKNPSVAFTEVSTNKQTFVQGNENLSIALNEAYKDFGDKKVTSTLKLVNATGTDVNFETIFSKLSVNVGSDTITPSDLTGNSVVLINDLAREDNASDAITINFDALNTAHGDYKFVITVADGTSTIGTKELSMKFVTVEEALIDYETLVSNISDSDLSALETEKDDLEKARQTAKNAIDALTESDKKTELNARYTSAYDKQNEGYKLYYLYKSKEKHLELYKVKNVGGNVPFAIVFDKAKLVGSAKEVFYYVPNSNEQHTVADLTPSSDRILFNQTSLNDGEYIYIYKFGDDDYYRTIVTVSNKVITKVDDIDVTGIDEQGKSFTAPGKGVNKDNLKGLLDNANQLVKDHAVGTEVGQVSQETLDNFKKSITSAQTVYDDDDAQEADVTGAVTALTSATQTFTDAIVDYHPNKENLAKAITDATTKVESATVGEEIGQTTQENIDTYKAAIAKAKATMDSVNDVENYDNKDAYDADVKKLDDALTELNEATKTYDSKVVSGESYAEAKLAIYEKAADNFLNNIRKKISI
jgi:hypothetical protein